MLRIFFSWLVVSLLINSLHSQIPAENLLPCGTEPYKSEQLIYYQENLNNYRFLTDDTLFVPIKVHIVGTDEGLGYASESFVRNAFCGLNESFKQAAIQFYIAGEFNYIDNTEWYDHESFGPGREMIEFNNLPGVLNSYIVQTAGGACGYYSRGVDGVVLAKNCIAIGRETWAHELGHQFTLPHTFFGWEGTPYNPNEPTPERIWFRNAWREVERWDGENCTHAGDGFCDTTPDYLSSRWGCSANNPIGSLITDPLGIQGNVDGTNIMSYASDACMSLFSKQQIQAMRMNLLLDRVDIINFENEFGIIHSEVELIYPQANQDVQFDEAVIKWRSVPNATEYHVQVSPLPLFSNLLFDDFVSDTILYLPPLIKDRTHYVRIKPSSPISLCEGFGERVPFLATQLTHIQFIGSYDFTIDFQNIIQSGQSLNIALNGSSAEDFRIQLLNLSGQTVYQDERQLIPGQNFRLPTNYLSPGMYLLTIETKDNQNAVRKVVIQ